MKGGQETYERPRKYERFPCDLLVTLELPTGASVPALACDVSMGGANIVPLERLAPGAALTLRFGQPYDAFGVPARVAWSVSPRSIDGAGVAFQHNPQSKALLRRIVASVAAPKMR